MANKFFGEKLRKLRYDKGLTQQQVADLLGLKNKSTLGSWEVGKSEPDGVTFLKLLKIYDVSDIYATFDENGPENDNLTLSPTEKQVIVEYRKADEVTKEMVHRVLHIEEKRDSERMA